MSRVHLVAGNRLTLLKNGEQYFPKLCQAIEAAQYSVYLETYIYVDDSAGRMVGDALRQAAARGVGVHLLLDGYGSAGLSQDFIDGLREAGVLVRWFRRDLYSFPWPRYGLRHLRRMHRKLAVIDSKIAFAGGINIIDDVPADFHTAVPRLDYAMRIEGGVAEEMQTVMQQLWEVVSWATLRKRIRVQKLHFRTPRSARDENIQLLVRDNVRHRRDIERLYVRAISAAKEEVIIANAYFLPGRLLRRALLHAARRGIRVVVLLQGKVEYHLQHYATLALYHRLLQAGVEIYEYQPSYLHAKVAVIDREWVTIGSFNFDPFSLLLAREANVVVRDAGFAAELRDSLQQAMEQDSRRVTPDHIGGFSRIWAYISYGLIRFAIGILGISKRH